jgi:hypothetical protein
MLNQHTRPAFIRQPIHGVLSSPGQTCSLSEIGFKRDLPTMKLRVGVGISSSKPGIRQEDCSGGCNKSWRSS